MAAVSEAPACAWRGRALIYTRARNGSRGDVSRSRALALSRSRVRRRAALAFRAMYVSMSRLRVDAAQSDALVAAFRRRAHLVDCVEGFLGVEVWRSDRDPEEVLMVSRWRDRAAFTAYMRSDDHRISHDRIEPPLKAA